MARITVYPSTSQYQRSGEDEVPLVWAPEYLRYLVNSIPQEHRAGARLKGWAGIEVYYERELTDVERMRSAIGVVRDALATNSRTGMTPEQVNELRKLLP